MNFIVSKYADHYEILLYLDIEEGKSQDLDNLLQQDLDTDLDQDSFQELYLDQDSDQDRSL